MKIARNARLIRRRRLILCRRLRLRGAIRRRAAMTRFAALAADRGHVRAIRAHRFATLAPCFARFFGRELVSGTQPMGSASAQARDASLLFGIHRSESAAAGFRVVSVIHGDYLDSSEKCDWLAEPTVVKAGFSHAPLEQGTCHAVFRPRHRVPPHRDARIASERGNLF